ncbi:MAG TPA: CaiB/BaiF CoA-transferase family protein [Xanthomonadales bacterium]|nr:CaiB/BaiF CoA-transferase family protein [Xanthomonadales bacterium]
MGPLKGFRIIEIAGLGPGPFCGMMLADMGASVIRVERTGETPSSTRDPQLRNRQSICLDLKTPQGIEVLLKLAEGADALFEGFRPGVAERLGFAPEVCLQRNPRLVYGRITGWGQSGPLASTAGHDINYIALSGALHAIGIKGQKPVPPLNLLGDFGGGGMLLAFGILCALLETSRSGKGQVVDAAMLEGSIALMAMFHAFRAMGQFDEQTGTHFLSGAAHFYETYETRDGKYLAVGALEPQFYRQFLEISGLGETELPNASFSLLPGRMDPSGWPALKQQVATAIRQKTRDEWCELFEGTDACVTPVLTTTEASQHPHNVARGNFVEVDGVLQHAPTPRFDRTPGVAPAKPRKAGADTRELLLSLGYSARQVEELLASGIASEPNRN